MIAKSKGGEAVNGQWCIVATIVGGGSESTQDHTTPKPWRGAMWCDLEWGAAGRSGISYLSWRNEC